MDKWVKKLIKKYNKLESGAERWKKNRGGRQRSNMVDTCQEKIFASLPGYNNQ